MFHRWMGSIIDVGFKILTEVVMFTRNSRGGVTIRDAFSRCYVAPAEFACTVTSHNNRRGDAAGVLYESAPRYCFVQRFGAVLLRFQV